MILTSEQFNTLATKKDLNGVKEDLNGVKEDLNGVKEDLNGVKEDVRRLDKKVDRVIIDQINTREEVREIKNNMATKEDVNRILAAVDKITKDNEDIKAEQTANLAAHDRFENRISNIETNLNLKPIS